LEKSHPAFAAGKHGTGPHVKNTATTRASMNHTGREQAGQQTAADFYRYQIDFFIFHFLIQNCETTPPSGSQG
jgi:hypothetical protein